MSGAADLPAPAAAHPADGLALLRGAVFVAAFVLAWVTLTPFQSLQSSGLLAVSSGNKAMMYVAFAALAAGAAALAGPRLRHLLPCLRPLPVLALGGWLAVTSLLSQDPSASIRALALTTILVTLTACLWLMPRDQRELATLLAAAAGIVLLLSYGGMLLAPELTIHQATDTLEPQLAGDWRGVFGHKNDAAAVFSLLVFVGLFVARSGLRLAGTAIALAAALFVLNAGGKSALMLVVASFFVGLAWERMRSRPLRVALALAPLALLLTVGIGSVLVPALAGFTKALPVDASFTGRTDIWEFAVDKLHGHLATGYGFQAFWNTEATRFGSDEDGWAGTAAHAHNGYLDMVVNMGLPGLALVLVVFVAMPMRDFFAAERRGADPALTLMLLQIWLFGLYLSAVETFLFLLANAIWVTFLFAVLGLRMAACHRLKGLG